VATILWLVTIEPKGLRGLFGNLPMLSQCSFVDMTQWWAMAIIARFTR
jgi:hypothetical protein